MIICHAIFHKCYEFGSKIQDNRPRRSVPVKVEIPSLKVRNVLPKVSVPPWLNPVNIWLQTVSG